MIEWIVLLAWELSAAVLVWTCFCRTSHTHKGNTKRAVRWAFQGLGVLSILSFVAPFYGYEPDRMAVMLLVWIAIVQIVTAHHWRQGVPVRFRRQ
jgi:hypothetical protein